VYNIQILCLDVAGTYTYDVCTITTVPYPVSILQTKLVHLMQDMVGDFSTLHWHLFIYLFFGSNHWRAAWCITLWGWSPIVCQFGVPDSLHTDQGKNFDSMLIKEVCRLLGIDKTRTTAYHPQSDGLVERLNRTILGMLSTVLEEDFRDWDLRLPLIMLAYRTSVQETTGASPFSLMFGREARLPIDVMFGLPTGQIPTSPNQSITTWKTSIIKWGPEWV